MFLRIQNRNVHVRVQGASNAPALLMLHALGSCMEIWDTQAEALSQHFRVVRFDMRGHGLSASTEGPLSMERLAQDALEVLDALQIDTAHVAGVSIGGMIAQCLTAMAPQRVRSLILCNTAPIFPPEMQQMWRERAVRVRAEGLEPIVDEIVSRWVTVAAQASPEAEGLRTMVRTASRFSYAACGEAIAASDLRESTATIRARTLVLAADDDKSTPPAAVKAMADLIPGSTYLLLTQSAHIPMMEHPEVVLAAMQDFLLK